MPQALDHSDERVEIVVNGVLQFVFADIQSFNLDPQYDETDIQSLGSIGSRPEKVLKGYTGSVTLMDTLGQIEAWRDLDAQSESAGTEVDVSISHVRIYPTGPQARTWSGVVVSFGRTTQVGQKSQITVNLRAGQHPVVT